MLFVCVSIVERVLVSFSHSSAALITPGNLLLQHDAVDGGLEQGKDETRLALELAQAVEDLGRGLVGHGVENGSELFCVSIYWNVELNMVTSRPNANLLHVLC